MQRPGAYARRVLVNLILDESRSHARWQRELHDERTPDRASSETGLDEAEERLDLANALAGLPARQRAVLVLRYFLDLPESEIAEIVGCAPGTVKSSAARGLASLRETIGAHSRPRGAADDSIQGAATWTHK
jgi:RNA polymerase sigma factor (sigma-70 family)